MHEKRDGGNVATALDEVLADFMRRVDRGESVDQQALMAAHPELAHALRAYFSQADALEGFAADATVDFAHQATPHGALEVRCPRCHTPTRVAADIPLTDLTCIACGSHFSLVNQHTTTGMAQKGFAAEHLLKFRGNSIGRFRVWLGTIFVNNVRNFLRHNRLRFARQARLPVDADGQLLRAARSSSELALHQREEENAQLPAALGELEADDREVIVAHFLQSTAYSQLADRFEVSEEALRQKGRRAVARLERAQRLLAAMHRKHLPPHYRKMLCALRLRNWPTERIATEFGLTEQAVRGFLERAEMWMQSPGDNR